LIIVLQAECFWTLALIFRALIGCSFLSELATVQKVSP